MGHPPRVQGAIATLRVQGVNALNPIKKKKDNTL